MKKTVYESECTPRLHVSKTNSKLGRKMVSIGYVPGTGYRHLKNGTLVTDVIGTCPGNCKECEKNCYACRSHDQYPAKTVSNVENTMQVRDHLHTHFLAIDAYLKEHDVKILRYTESGEIESYNQFMALVWLAQHNAGTSIYFYTKRYDLLRRYLGYQAMPKNLVALVSIWGSLGREEWSEFKQYDNIKCFAVHAEDMHPDAMCPAYKLVNGKVVRTGITCDKCKLCFDSKAKMIGCYEH